MMTNTTCPGNSLQASPTIDRRSGRLAKAPHGAHCWVCGARHENRRPPRAPSPMQLWARQAHRKASKIWAQCTTCGACHPVREHVECRRGATNTAEVS